MFQIFNAIRWDFKQKQSVSSSMGVWKHSSVKLNLIYGYETDLTLDFDSNVLQTQIYFGELSYLGFK